MLITGHLNKLAQRELNKSGNNVSTETCNYMSHDQYSKLGKI